MFDLYCYILLQFLLFSQVLSIDYCEFCDGHHTMCMFKNPSPNCRNYTLTKLKTKDRNEIVDIHNAIRSDIALGKAQGKDKQLLPSASSMREIKWDDELETIATQWALQCTSYEEPLQHDACRFVDRFDVGQNIHTIFSVSPPSTTFSERILNWYEEIMDFNFTEFLNEGSLRPNPADTSVLHVTQMIYSQLEYVGCAEILFTAKVRIRNGTVLKLGYIKRFICNYGPLYDADDDLYTIGLPCSDCPVNLQCNRDKGLCADPLRPSQLLTSEILTKKEERVYLSSNDLISKEEKTTQKILSPRPSRKLQRTTSAASRYGVINVYIQVFIVIVTNLFQ